VRSAVDPETGPAVDGDLDDRRPGSDVLGDEPVDATVDRRHEDLPAVHDDHLAPARSGQLDARTSLGRIDVGAYDAHTVEAEPACQRVARSRVHERSREHDHHRCGRHHDEAARSRCPPARCLDATQNDLDDVPVVDIQHVTELREACAEIGHVLVTAESVSRSSTWSLARARAVRDFTVPTATPSTSAVSTSVNPVTNRHASTSR
jgi:hypothetical protein